MRQDIYEYIQIENLDTQDVAALTSALQAVTTKQHIPKSAVNNHIVSNSYNLRLRAITNEAIPHEIYDAEIPDSGGITLRLAAQAGLDWLLADSGAQVNPANETLNSLLALLNTAGVFSNDEVAAFWAMFDTPRWPGLTEAQVRGALNTPAIEATQGIISDAEALNATLTQEEATRRSTRVNEIAALHLVLEELESGDDVTTPAAPSGSAWEAFE